MLSKAAKKRIEDTDIDISMEAALAKAHAVVDRAVAKYKKKYGAKDPSELYVVLTVLQLELAKKTEALRQANRGFDRLHRNIDRLRNERVMETAIFKRNMAMLHKGLFNPTVAEPFSITFVTEDKGAKQFHSVGDTIHRG